jgi:hypothetical protein
MAQQPGLTKDIGLATLAAGLALMPIASVVGAPVAVLGAIGVALGVRQDRTAHRRAVESSDRKEWDGDRRLLEQSAGVIWDAASEFRPDAAALQHALRSASHPTDSVDANISALADNIWDTNRRETRPVHYEPLRLAQSNITSIALKWRGIIEEGGDRAERLKTFVQQTVATGHYPTFKLAWYLALSWAKRRNLDYFSDYTALQVMTEVCRPVSILADPDATKRITPGPPTQ